MESNILLFNKKKRTERYKSNNVAFFVLRPQLWPQAINLRQTEHSELTRFSTRSHFQLSTTDSPSTYTHITSSIWRVHLARQQGLSGLTAPICFSTPGYHDLLRQA